MAHLKGKLKVVPRQDGFYSARAQDCVSPPYALHTSRSITSSEDTLHAAACPADSTSKDNIERAVACWNFCEPLSTETLLACENLGDAIKAELAQREQTIARLQQKIETLQGLLDKLHEEDA